MEVVKETIPYYWENQKSDQFLAAGSENSSIDAVAKLLPTQCLNIGLVAIVACVIPFIFRFTNTPYAWIVWLCAVALFVRSCMQYFPILNQYKKVAREFVDTEINFRSVYPRAIMNHLIAIKKAEIEGVFNMMKQEENAPKIRQSQEAIHRHQYSMNVAKKYHQSLYTQLLEAMRNLDRTGNEQHINPRYHNVVLSTGEQWYADPAAEDPMVIAAEAELQALDEKLQKLKSEANPNAV